MTLTVAFAMKVNEAGRDLVHVGGPLRNTRLRGHFRVNLGFMGMLKPSGGVNNVSLIIKDIRKGK